LRAKIVERLADYPWSSYRALAYGRGGPAWFDRRRAYEQFGLDARGFRQAVRQYDEGRDDLLANLYYGLVLGRREYADLRRPTRHVERPERDLLMYLLWREGRSPLEDRSQAPEPGRDGDGVSHNSLESKKISWTGRNCRKTATSERTCAERGRKYLCGTDCEKKIKKPLTMCRWMCKMAGISRRRGHHL
jgi:hypothetical protein